MVILSNLLRDFVVIILNLIMSEHLVHIKLMKHRAVKDIL